MSMEEHRRANKEVAVTKEIETRFERSKQEMLSAFRGLNAVQRGDAMQDLMKDLSESFI